MEEREDRARDVRGEGARWRDESGGADTEEEGICAVGEHAAGASDDDEVGVTAGVVNGVDAEFVIEPLQGLGECGHRVTIDNENLTSSDKGQYSIYHTAARKVLRY